MPKSPLSILTALLLLAAVPPALAAPLKVLLYAATTGAPTDSLGPRVNAAIAARLARRFACVEIITPAATAARVASGWRLRLLGGRLADEDWPRVMGPTGVRFVVVTRVTPKPNSVALSTNLLRAATGGAVVGRLRHLAKDADTALECARIAEDFAKQLSAVPAFSSDSCPPAPARAGLPASGSR